MLNRAVALSYLFVLLGTVPASGQERHGFWFNGGLGYGSLGCDNCDGREGGLSGGLSLGGTISPQFLLGVGTTGWTKSEGGVTLTTGTLDARMRFYPSRTGGFFLTGGLGVGTIHASASGFGSTTETGVGVVLGLGYDIRVGSGLSVTPFWNGFAVRNSNSDDNVGQIGLSLTVHKFREPADRMRELVPVSPGRLINPPRTEVPVDVQAAGPRDTAAAPPLPTPRDTVAARLPTAPAGSVQALPSGTQFVGDTRLKLYYPVKCSERKAIPPQYQVFFLTSAGAERDGFRASGDC